MRPSLELYNRTQFRAARLLFLVIALNLLCFNYAALAQNLSYEALAEALANEEIRNKLIDELRALADPSATPIPPAPAVSIAAPIISEPSRYVLHLQDFAHVLRSDVIEAWQTIRLLAGGKIQHLQQLPFWQTALLNLLISLITVSLSYLLVRRLAMPLFTRLNAWVQREPSPAKVRKIQDRQHQRQQERQQLAAEMNLNEDAGEDNTDTAAQQKIDTQHVLSLFKLRYQKMRKLAAAALAFIIDSATVALAALIGYFVLLVLPSAQKTQNATLLSMQFLTAFFAIELLKAISRRLFSTRYEPLRLIPLNNEEALYWNRWVATILTLGGYGLLVLIPTLENVVSPALANVVGAILILVVYIYAVYALWSNRKSVTNRLLKAANKIKNTANTKNSFMASILHITAKLWLWITLLYLTVLFIITQADQKHALGFMVNASAQTLFTVLIGGVLSLLLSTLVTHRIHLPTYWNQAFPLLESRLNSYIPAIFHLLRILVLAAVLLSIFDAWQLLSLKTWFSSAQGQAMLGTIIRVAFVLIIAAVSWTVCASIIEHRLADFGSKMPTEREKTLLLLFRNALAIVIVTMSSLIILSQLSIDIGPLIAGAGIIGLAVGFGAQKLVQDVITGVFIQLENGMNQNDIVEVVGLFGTVEKLTIRSVVIRTLDGGYHLVPFSSIDCVTNYTRDYGFHVGEYLISLSQPVDEAIVHLQAAFEELKQNPELNEAILEDMTVPGVTYLGHEGVKIRILIKTKPGMQWPIQRSFNRLVKQHFDAAGIEIPYPQTVLHFGRDKNDKAAPATEEMVDALAQLSRPKSGF